MSSSSYYGVIHHGHIDPKETPKASPLKRPLIERRPTRPAALQPETRPEPVPINEIPAQTLPGHGHTAVPVSTKRPIDLPKPISKPVDTQIVSEMPVEIRKMHFHPGAMFLPFWWLLFHKFYGSAVVYLVTVLCLAALLMPLTSSYFGPHSNWIATLIAVGIPAIATGVAAHRVAWRRCAYKDLAHYEAIEGRWTVVGTFVSAAGLAISYLPFLHH